MDRKIIEVLRQVEYKEGWDLELNLRRDTDLNPQLRWTFRDHKGEDQNGRWWRLSHHMTPGELVQTALKAALTAEEHEAREWFTYKGKAIFGPHLDIDKLVEIADATVMREEMGA